MTNILMWHLMITGTLAAILLLVIAAQTVRAVAVRAGRAGQPRRVPRMQHVRPFPMPSGS
jgi:uncharacterized integral membrane protein